MSRDFTYIDGLVTSIRLLMDKAPVPVDPSTDIMIQNENKSPVAPFRIVNLGNSKPQKLEDFIFAIERSWQKS